MCRKKPYTTKEAALNVAAKCVCRAKFVYLRVYYHDDCKAWHITKMRKA